MDRVADVEEGLRLLQRHESDGSVIFGHAHLEYRRYRISFHAGRRAEGRRCSTGRENSDLAPHKDVQRIGEPRTDGDAVGLVEVDERAVADIARDGFQVAQILRSQAPHDDARRVGLRRHHHLPFDHRQRNLTPGTALSRSAVSTKSLKGRASGLTITWPLRPRILIEQLLAEAVHDREHDNQGRDAERDAQHAEEGDDGYAAFLAASAQDSGKQAATRMAQTPSARSRL